MAPKRKPKPATPSESDHESDGPELEHHDTEERDFAQDVPLNKAAADHGFRHLKEIWEKMATDLEVHAVTMGEVAEHLVSCFDKQDEEWKQVFARMDSDARLVCDRHFEARTRSQVIHDLRQRILANEEFTGADTLYEEQVKELLDTYQAAPARKKYGNSEVYQRFREAVWNAQDPDLQMPSLKSLIEVETGDEDSDDSDVEQGAVARNFKDPVSLKTIEVPVTSGKCSHSYDQKTILGLIHGQAGPHACPVAGCSARFGVSDLRVDVKLQKILQRHLKKEAREADKEKSQSQKKKRQVVVEDSEEEE